MLALAQDRDEDGRARVAAAKVLGEWLGLKYQEQTAAVSVNVEVNQMMAEARAIIQERVCPSLMDERERAVLELARERRNAGELAPPEPSGNESNDDGGEIV